MSMTFEQLREVNMTRCQRWHDPESWSLSDWGVAMAGEAGEVCNAIKKMNRLRDSMRQKTGPQDSKTALQALATEIGDTAVYLDLLAQRAGLRLEDCVRDTFNRVSVREGFPDRL